MILGGNVRNNTLKYFVIWHQTKISVDIDMNSFNNIQTILYSRRVQLLRQLNEGKNKTKKGQNYL